MLITLRDQRVKAMRLNKIIVNQEAYDCSNIFLLVMSVENVYTE